MTDEQLEDFIYGEKQKRDIVVDGRGGGCAETPESENDFGHIVYIMTRNSFPDAYF